MEATPVTVSELVEKMGAFRLRGNDAFIAGDTAEAIALYTQGLECIPATDDPHDQNPQRAEACAALLNNRAAAHARLGEWRSSLDDAIMSISHKPDVPKAWARAITAVVKLNLKTIAIDCLLRQAASTLNERQAASVRSMTNGVLSETCPVPNAEFPTLLIKLVHDDGSPWLPLRIACILMAIANRNAQHIPPHERSDAAEVINLQTMGVLPIVGQRLAETEASPSLLSRCSLTRSAAEDTYSLLKDTLAVWRGPTSDLLFQNKDLMRELRLSFSVAGEVPEPMVRLRCRQLQLVDQLDKQSMDVGRVLGVAPDVARPWVKWAGSLRGDMRRGDVASPLGFIGLARLTLLLTKAEDVLEVGGANLVARLMEGCAGVVRICETDNMTEAAVSYTFRLAKLICDRSKGPLMDAFGEGIAGQARIVSLSAYWTTHWNQTIYNEAGLFLTNCLPEILEYPSFEIRPYVNRQLCAGACEPQAQEEVEGDFVLHHRRPYEGWRRCFCSHKCMKEQMAVVLSARTRHRTAGVDWTEAVMHFRRVHMNMEMPMAGMDGLFSVLDPICEGTMNSAGALFIDERLPQMRGDIHMVREALKVGDGVGSPDIQTSMDWVMCCLDLLRMQEEVDVALGKSDDAEVATPWHKQAANVDRARALKVKFASLKAKFNAFRSQAIISPLSRLLRNSRAPLSIPKTALAASAVGTVRMRLLEMQAVIVVQFLWEDTDLYDHVVFLLNEWMSTSLDWDQPRAWLLRGHLYALLLYLGEEKGCMECAAAGHSGFGGCLMRYEQLADSEELGLPPVLRWLGRIHARGSEPSNAIKAADAAEKWGPKLWGDAGEREWRRLHRYARATYDRTSAEKRESEELRELVPSSFYKACEACGKSKLQHVNGKRVKLKKCSNCLVVAYCSPVCQKIHWKVHKPFCKKPEKEADGAEPKPKEEKPARPRSSSSPAGHHHNIFQIPILLS